MRNPVRPNDEQLFLNYLKPPKGFLRKTFMEKFMLIFHGGQVDSLSPEQMQSHFGKWMGWVQKLKTAGVYVSGEPLLPGGKLVQGAGGKTVTDGPFTEGKEVVGGYFIVNANDYNEAVTIAKECPDFDLGGAVQVRQVMKIEM